MFFSIVRRSYLKGYSANRPVPYVRVLTGGLYQLPPPLLLLSASPPVCRRRRLLPLDPFNRDGCLEMVNGPHLCSAFLNSGPSKSLPILPLIHPFMHTFTHPRRCQQCEVTASWSGAVRMRCPAQGHLDTRLGGDGGRTSNLRLPVNPLYLLNHKPPRL